MEIVFFSRMQFPQTCTDDSCKSPSKSHCPQKCSVLETHGTHLHCAVVITVNLLLVWQGGEKKKKISGRGLNCTSVIEKRPGPSLDVIRTVACFWSQVVLGPNEDSAATQAVAGGGGTERWHLSPGRCYSPSQGSIVIASLELTTDRDVAQADEAEMVRPCVQQVPA